MGQVTWACRFLGAGVLCVLHAQVPNAPASKPAKLELTVVDSITNQPVANASVELDRISPPPSSVRHATSDEHGHASFPQVEPGKYRIALIQVAGYTYDPPDTLSSSFTPITVEEGAVVQAGNVAVVPLGAIQGTVTDEMGEPVVGAEVTVLRFSYLAGLKTLAAPAQAAPGTTDARGRYRTSAVLPGRYYVRVSVASFRRLGAAPASMVFAPVYYPNAEAASRAVRIEVYPGAGTPPVNFRLRPTDTFHLRGSVVGISDKLRPRVIEIASCTPGIREDPALVTATALRADGSFDAEGVPRGTYCLTFQGLSGNELTSYAMEVVTVINRDIENIRLAAALPLDIPGVVTLEEGAALKRPASVQLRPATQITVPSSTGSVDGTNGAFRLVGVRPADYKLAVTSVPTGGYIKSMEFGGVDVSDGKINPSGGGTLMIQIGAARCSLTGRVDFGSGQAIRGMRVTLAPDGALSDRIDLIRTVFANDKGEFKLTDLAPGSYRIFPWEKFEFDLAQSPEFLSLFSASSVRVAEGEQPNVEVKMISSSEIEAAKARF
jgi:hypothetical protein